MVISPKLIAAGLDPPLHHTKKTDSYGFYRLRCAHHSPTNMTFSHNRQTTAGCVAHIPRRSSPTSWLLPAISLAKVSVIWVMRISYKIIISPVLRLLIVIVAITVRELVFCLYIIFHFICHLRSPFFIRTPCSSSFPATLLSLAVGRHLCISINECLKQSIIFQPIGCKNRSPSRQVIGLPQAGSLYQ